MKYLKLRDGSTLMVAQTEDDAKVIFSYEHGMTCARCDVDSSIRLQIFPDIQAVMAPKTGEYDKMSVPDLLTKAAESGINVSPNTIRDDLVKIVDTAKVDKPKAAEMATKARTASSKKTSTAPIAGNGGGFEYSAKSSNS